MAPDNPLQKMYMVNLSMLSTLFMAISDRAARLTNIYKFCVKGGVVCTGNSMAASCGPIQVAEVVSFLGFLGVSRG